MKKIKIDKPEIFVSPNEYKINGKSYYRVTATLGVISKHRLRSWMGRIGYKKANQILETRQAIGTHVHKLIENLLKGKQINLGSYEKEIQDGLKEFKKFAKLSKLKPQGLEQNLWSNEYGYAGTADYIGYYTSCEEYLVATIKNHKRVKEPKFAQTALVIGDWKTGKDIYPTYWLQLAAYVNAFEELTGIKVAGVFIARIRDGKISIKEKAYDELMKEFPAYLAALTLYEWRYKKGKFAFLKKR